MSPEKESPLFIKFFFFAFLDEDSALRASMQTRSAMHSKSLQNNDYYSSVRIAEKIARRYLLTQKTQFQVTYHNGWESAMPIKIDGWLAFKRVASMEELFAWIWIEIVGLDRPTLARSLSITEGTLVSRLESALRKFSQVEKSMR